jgi:ribonucleotide reductase alpha subunit
MNNNLSVQAFPLTPLGQVVWEDRYGLKDENGNLLEKSILDTFRRVAKAISSKEKEPLKWEEEFYQIMANRYYCPAGRILAHAGTHYSQLLNCFVVPFKDDSLEEIMNTAKNMAVIQKHGGGTGFNFSQLRPSGSHIKGVNGRSCGVLGFIQMMSTASEVIEQGGSRRGANLGLLEIWHPDLWEYISFKREHNWDALEEFIDVKDQEKWTAFKFNNQYKWQMFNVSVGVNDDFFAALKKDEDWIFAWKGVEWRLHTVAFKKFIEKDIYKEIFFNVMADSDKTALWKVKREVPYPSANDKFEITNVRRVKASEVWDRICYNAWADGCPGLLNMSTLKVNHNIEYARPILSTNPCLTGDTLVAVADGRNAVSIKQLAEENKDVPVYCRGDKGNVTVRVMRNPRVTGYNQKILKVMIEGQHVVRVTENHKFVLADGSIRMAKELVAGDSLSK